MGGSAKLYDAIYKLQAPQLRPAFEAPEVITEDNYHNFLGHRESVPIYPRSSEAHPYAHAVNMQLL